MNADWKIQLFDADANKVASEIEALGDDITPAQILDKARDENTELHKCFEWDDSKAAEKYRLIQAEKVIRLLVIEHPGENAETSSPIRCFYKTSDGQGYKPSKVIFQNPNEYQALLLRAKEELRAFKAKYSMLHELDEILSLID